MNVLLLLFGLTGVATARSVADTFANIQGPLTADFQSFLQSNSKYSAYASQFVRTDLGVYGSYGGRTSPGQKVVNQPVIFIHGNSDMALNNPNNQNIDAKDQTGWSNNIQYFTSQGYTSAELYATTWGPANPSLASDQTHSCEYLKYLRAFVEAVIDYTGADKVDVIGHSMGVTLGRKILQGGSNTDSKASGGASCNIGSSLKPQVDSFVGICGGNRGLTACYADEFIAATCNNVNGFFPGNCATLVCNNLPNSAADFLVALNAMSGTESQYLFTMWSTVDTVIGEGDEVWGEPTSRVPGQDAEYVSNTLDHMPMKEDTSMYQYNAVTKHSFN